MPNNHEFKLQTVRCFLQTVLNGKIINYQLPYLLRETCLIGNNPIFGRLKEFLQWFQGSDTDFLRNICEFRENENKKIKKEKEKEKEKLKEKERDDKVKLENTREFLFERMREKEKVLPVNSYFWVEATKFIIQNGCVLELTNPKIKAALRIFLQQLKKCFVDFSEKQDAIALQMKESVVFLEFIGQLCQLGYYDSAEVIHNFVHFGLKTTEQQSNDSSFIENFAVGLAGPLCDALELTGNISGRSAGNDYKFFVKLTAIWIRHPIFKRAFDKKSYKAFMQNPELFNREMALHTELEKMLLQAPLQVLEEALAKLHLSFESPVEINLEGRGVFQYLSYTRPLPPIPSASLLLPDLSLENKSDQKRLT